MADNGAVAADRDGDREVEDDLGWVVDGGRLTPAREVFF